MNTYRLDLILQAAAFFAQEDGVFENFAYDLKTIQSKKDSSRFGDVKEIDENTLVEALIKQTKCVSDVAFSILNKYEEIRTADWPALFKSKCSEFYSEYFFKMKT